MSISVFIWGIFIDTRQPGRGSNDEIRFCIEII